MMGVYCYFVLVDFKAKKTQFVLLDWSSNNVGIGVKMYVFVLEEKSSCKMLGLVSFLIWTGALPLSQLQKLPPRKLEA